MSYYLALVGVGLVFVLAVHVYNRYTIYQQRKIEKSKLFGFANSAKHEGGNPELNSTTTINLLAESTIKEKYKKNLLVEENSKSGELGKFFECVVISNLDKLAPEEINSWINQIIRLPFIFQINVSPKKEKLVNKVSDKNSQLIWDELLPNNTVTLTKSISTLKLFFKLANRSGHMDTSMLKNIRDKLTELTTKSAAKFTIGEFSEIVSRAESLDRLCAKFDVQIVITLLCRNQAGVSGGQIAKSTVAQGMIFENGAFYKLSPDGQIQYKLEFQVPAPLPQTLAELETRISNRAILSVDIPKTKDGNLAFSEMSVFAQHLTAVINADLVDDRLQPLSSTSLETIAEQIGQIQKQMIEKGFTPGSENVNRLFS